MQIDAAAAAAAATAYCDAITTAVSLLLLCLLLLLLPLMPLQHALAMQSFVLVLLTGGLLWFSDLCQPALNLAAVTAPVGSLGMVLPAGVALAMFANIQRSFGVTDTSKNQGERSF